MLTQIWYIRCANCRENKRMLDGRGDEASELKAHPGRGCQNEPALAVFSWAQELTLLSGNQMRIGDSAQTEIIINKGEIYKWYSNATECRSLWTSLNATTWGHHLFSYEYNLWKSIDIFTFDGWTVHPKLSAANGNPSKVYSMRSSIPNGDGIMLSSDAPIQPAQIRWFGWPSAHLLNQFSKMVPDARNRARTPSNPRWHCESFP